MGEKLGFPPNHNGDPHLIEVFEIVGDLKKTLSIFSRSRAWAPTADFVDLTAVAQAALTVSRFTMKRPESAAARKLRLAAKRFERQLKAHRESVKAKYPEGPDEWIATIDHDLQIVSKYSNTNEITPIWFIARHVLDAFGLANKLARISHRL